MKLLSQSLHHCPSVVCRTNTRSISKVESALSFPLFMRRQKILGLYRSILKAAKKMESPDMRDSIRNEVRNGFKVNKHLVEKISINACVKEAETSLRTLKGLAKEGDDNYDCRGGDGSWLDNSDEDDQRGRMGTGWPWER